MGQLFSNDFVFDEGDDIVLVRFEKVEEILPNSHRGEVLWIVSPDLEDRQIEIIEVLSFPAEDVHQDALVLVERRSHGPEFSFIPEEATQVIVILRKGIIGHILWERIFIFHSLVFPPKAQRNFSFLKVDDPDKVLGAVEEKYEPIADRQGHESRNRTYGSDPA